LERNLIGRTARRCDAPVKSGLGYNQRKPSPEKIYQEKVKKNRQKENQGGKDERQDKTKGKYKHPISRGNLAPIEAV
jgi:hypothetical protein